ANFTASDDFFRTSDSVVLKWNYCEPLQRPSELRFLDKALMARQLKLRSADPSSAFGVPHLARQASF
ncbi:MAG: hypothetical protein ACJ8AC_07325, partial [Gemmatimonadaceae bacterium]